MKRYRNLSTTAFTFASLMAAYQRARRGRRHRSDVLEFGRRREENVLYLSEELRSGAYQHGPYRAFTVYDAKKRHIQAATFRDRVVHQAVHGALEPVFERSFIFDSYACRKDKGVLAAIKRFERYARVNHYVLSMDISRYFASIDHERLLALLARKVNDSCMYTVCERIIRSISDGPGKGIPIGNLTSQLFANVYLNELDQYAKHTLRCKRYIRYMDDIVVFSNDKRFLHDVRREIDSFIAERLYLSFHPKKVQLTPVSVGVDYLGYRIYPHYKRLRKSSVKRFIARSRRLYVAEPNAH